MTSEPSPPQDPPLPPSGDADAERRESVLAYLLDALEEEEREVVIARLQSDPLWQEAERDAKRMLLELQSEGDVPLHEPPITLAGKTIRNVRELERQRQLQRVHWLEITPRIAAAIFILACLPLVWLMVRRAWQETDPASIRWLSEPQLVAGASFAPRLEVRGAVHALPLENIEVQAALVSSADGVRYEIGEARTGSDGMPVLDSSGASRTLRWNVPDVRPGEYELQINACAPGGRQVDTAKRKVTVLAPVRLALAPDRLWVRPGETLRVRALLAAAHNQKPMAGENLSLDFFDPQGNRLGHIECKTSPFGLAWGEFPIDDEAPSGAYQVKAVCAGLSAEQRIQVRAYQLPPFRVLLQPAKPWYRPDASIDGFVSAITFDGHPMFSAKGELCLREPDGRLVARQDLTLNREGRADFALQIPADQRPATPVRWSLECELKDTAGRQASGLKDLSISAHEVCLQAIPEAGELVQSLTNRVYVVAWHPDGKPCANRAVEVLRYKGSSSESLHAGRTDARGVLVFELTSPVAPGEVIEVRGTGDEPGAFPAQRLALPVRSSIYTAEKPSGCLLIRPVRSLVATPALLNVDVLAQDDGPVALAVRQGERTLATASIEVEAGHGQGVVLLPEELMGAFTLDARQHGSRGAEWRDRRILFAAGSAKLKVTAGTDRERYKPGETARVSFRVSDEQGRGRPAALSLAGVDEALLQLTGGQISLTGGILKGEDDPSHVSGLPFGPRMLTTSDEDVLAAAACLAAIPVPVEKTPAGSTFESLAAQGWFGDPRMLDEIRRYLLNPVTPQELEMRDRLVEDLKRSGSWSRIAPLLEGSPDQSRVIDTAAEKASRQRQVMLETEHRISFWGSLLVQLLVVLIFLALSMNREVSGLDGVQSTKYMVAFITFLLWLFGVMTYHWRAGMQDGQWLVTALAAMLLVSHALLLWRATLLHWGLERSRDHVDLSPDRLTVGTVIADVLILLLVFAVWGSRRGSDDAAVVLAVCGFVAGLVQLCLATPSRDGGVRVAEIIGVLAILLVLAGLLMPVLARARCCSRETAMRSAVDGLAMAMDTKDAADAPKEAPSAVPAGPAPRVRRDFRETLIFRPQLITNEDGTAQLEIPLADSLTGWELQTDAVAQGGGLGIARCRFEVTQPFSVDLSLPPDVTEGDLLIVPAVLSNHSDEAREAEVTLSVEGAESVDASVRKITVAPKSVAAVEFPVRFRLVGMAQLRVTASSGALADAAERQLKVRPDARPVRFGASAFLGKEGVLNVTVPATSRPVTGRLTIHRTPLTQIEEGLESMLVEPHGCFEQTSSTSYPNAMVLRYLRAHSISKPEVEGRARDLLARGYQRLLTFEVGTRSGSFSLYGKEPASTWLTAYGLMQFNDLAEVFPVDPELLERTRRWLASQVQADGCYHEGVGLLRGVDPSTRFVAPTAYVVWALGASAPARSIEYLVAHADQIERDPYLCALTANALLGHDRALAARFARSLAALARVEERPERRVACLPCEQTLAWGRGDVATTEATALGALALLETGENPELAAALLAGIQERGHGGMWGSTHATIFCLKALVRSASAVVTGDALRVVVRCNGEVLPPIDVPAGKEASRIGQRIPLRTGANRVEIQTDGGAVVAGVSGEAMIPWDTQVGPAIGTVRASVAYDRNGLLCNESVLGSLRVSSVGRTAEVPMIEWALPAGFRPVAGDLEKLKADGRIMRWEVSGRYLRLYLPDVREEKVFGVRFVASAKGEFTSPAGKAYEYYRPDEACCLPAMKFTVR